MLGVVLALLAVGYVTATIQIPTGVAASTEVGPRTFPYLVGGALLMVSVGFLFAQALRLRGRSSTVSSGQASSGQKAEQEAGEQPGGEGQSAPEPPEHGSSEMEFSTISGRDWSSYSHVTMFAAVAIYVVLMNFVGFLIPTAIYIAIGTLIVSDTGSYRGTRLWVPAVYGLAGSVVLYLLFDGALNVALPQGILGL